jgi:hypothetical protein
MVDAAHPQQGEDGSGAAGPDPQAGSLLAKNPFPAQVTVLGVDGHPVDVELAVVDGVVYAPGLDNAPIDPVARQYVTNYCAAWSSSVVADGRLDQAWPEPPRRAQVLLKESQLHLMLGLKPDERLLRVVVDEVSGCLRFIVESPRLPRQAYWDGGPPVVTLPIAASYEDAGQAWAAQ